MTPSPTGEITVQGDFHSVTVRPPFRWSPQWKATALAHRLVGFILTSGKAPSTLHVRIDPARPEDRSGQAAIHRRILARYAETFVSPHARTVDKVRVAGQQIWIRYYTGVDNNSLIAVIPLERETVTFDISDEQGEDVRPLEPDFTKTVETAVVR
jgi:hypothetical protein